MRPHQSTLLIAGFATLAGFLIPIVRELLLPVFYLNTHLHEFSHALVAQATGAEVQKIVVHADGSGVTPVVGGSLLLIASAGYLGASIFGAAMIYFGREQRSARISLVALALLLTLSMAVWVRGDLVGELWGAAWIVIVGGIAAFVRGNALVFCCQFLGLQQCLNSVQSLFSLVKIVTATEVHSDAGILQDATGIPAVAWAVAWSVFSLVLVAITLRKSWQPAPKR